MPANARGTLSDVRELTRLAHRRVRGPDSRSRDAAGFALLALADGLQGDTATAQAFVVKS